MTTLRIALKTSELEPKNEKGREITAGEVSLSPEITYHSDRYPNGRSDRVDRGHWFVRLDNTHLLSWVGVGLDLRPRR